MLKLTRPKERKPAGRKPLPDGEKKVAWTVYARPAMKEKFARLGGNAWLEKVIAKAKEPQP